MPQQEKKSRTEGQHQVQDRGTDRGTRCGGVWGRGGFGHFSPVGRSPTGRRLVANHRPCRHGRRNLGTVSRGHVLGQVDGVYRRGFLRSGHGHRPDNRRERTSVPVMRFVDIVFALTVGLVGGAVRRHGGGIHRRRTRRGGVDLARMALPRHQSARGSTFPAVAQWLRPAA